MNPEDEHMPTTQSALLTVGELNVAFRTRCRKRLSLRGTARNFLDFFKESKQ